MTICSNAKELEEREINELLIKYNFTTPIAFNSDEGRTKFLYALRRGNIKSISVANNKLEIAYNKNE